MKIYGIIFCFVVVVTSGCVIAPAPPGYPPEVAPPLPATIYLDAGPYYFQGGFYYYYHNNRWDYGKSRGGPWYELPRSHWPREIRHNSRDEHREREYRNEHDHEQNGYGVR